MSESFINVEPSDLEKDSQIEGLDLCSDGSGNWFIRVSEGVFLTESGDTTTVEDGSIPESAVYSSIIKCQQIAQTEGVNTPSDSETVADGSTNNIEDMMEQNSGEIEESNDMEVEVSETEDDATETDEGNSTLEEDEPELEDDVFSDQESDQVNEGTPEEDHDIFEDIPGDKSEEDTSDDIFDDVIDEKDPIDETDEGIVSSVKELFDSEDSLSLGSIKKYFRNEEPKDEVSTVDNADTIDDSTDKDVDRIDEHKEDQKSDFGETNEFEEDVDSEDEEGLFDQIKSYFESDEEESQEQMSTETPETTETRDKTIIESIEQFLSSDIAEVDQKRPDAQNVSIDFLDRSEDDGYWSATMSEFWGKLRRARRGETEAKKDITADLWTRYKALVVGNTYARGDALDSFVGLFLFFVGFSAVVAGLFSMLLGDVASLEVLTVESTYGDHITLTTFVLFITGMSFWLSRRTRSKTLVSAIQTPARFLQLLIVGLQMIVVSAVMFMITLGGGREALGDLEQAAAQSVIDALSILPTTLYSPIVSLIETYRGPESITGFSIVEASVLMATVGVLIAYPVMKRSLARFVLTANMGAREFREETGILIEEISEGGQDFDEPDYILGDVTDEIDGDKTHKVTREQLYTVDGDADKEGLIALPDHIKSSPFANYKEVRRYWVRAPYAYISIVYDERQNDYRYVVVEPELDESEKVIFDELKQRLDNVLLFEDVEEYEDHQKEIDAKLKKLEKRMVQLSEEYELDINDKTFHRLMYFIERDYIYYNKIDPLINDPYVEDISCDGEEQHLFVFHSDYKDVMTNVIFEKEELRSFVQELAQRSGEHISAADPMVDASLPDGSRAQMTLGSEVTTHGSTFTIRLFEDIPFTPVDLLQYDTFSMTQMAYLWTAIEHNKSLIFAGGTASGKTTSMNAVSMFIPPKAKVITIEDTREISLPQKNWIPGTTREGVGGEEGGEDIDMYELLRAALRQRPEYIVVGEIRGREAETLFQAMNTGHTTYSTMHAETVDAAIGRLTNPPINVPKQMITALDIICIQNQIRFTDDEGNQMNVRRNEETREIVGLRDNGQFDNRRPFQWDAETDNFIESLEDSHVLERVANENGWTPEDKRMELKQREEVLEYMVEQDIREFDYVTNIIQAYMVDSEKIVREVRNDTLEPEDLKSLTEMEWETPEVEEPETTLNDQLEDNEQKASAEVQGDSQ